MKSLWLVLLTAGSIVVDKVAIVLELDYFQRYFRNEFFIYIVPVCFKIKNRHNVPRLKRQF